MVLLWAGAALLQAEKGFTKVKGYRHLHQLESALKNVNQSANLKAAQPDRLTFGSRGFVPSIEHRQGVRAKFWGLFRIRLSG